MDEDPMVAAHVLLHNVAGCAQRAMVLIAEPVESEQYVRAMADFDVLSGSQVALMMSSLLVGMTTAHNREAAGPEFEVETHTSEVADALQEALEALEETVARQVAAALVGEEDG